MNIKSLPAQANQLHPRPAAADSAAAVIPRAQRRSRLECAGSAAAAGEAVEAGGDLRRVHETWRWRGHKINFKVEGGFGCREERQYVLLCTVVEVLLLL